MVSDSNAPVAVSKAIEAVKLCSNQISSSQLVVVAN